MQDIKRRLLKAPVPSVILDCIALPFKPSTAKNLSNAIRRMLCFFAERSFQQPYGLVAFFHWLAAIATDGRSRPESALLQAHSAAKIFFDLTRMSPNPASDSSIPSVITGLTRRFTTRAQQHTDIFLSELPRVYAFLRSLPPVESNAASWDPKVLRAATVVVLGLHMAARPSDLVCIDRSTLSFSEIPISEASFTSSFASRFATKAHSSWGPLRRVRVLSFSILDTKTDKFSRGYDVSVFGLPPGDENICPVALCSAYLECFVTLPVEPVAPLSDPFFVSLLPPFHGLAAGTISNAAALLFEQAGIAQRFTGDSIRPTSATLMFVHGVASEIIMKVGRWSEESLALVLRHYVRFTSDFIEVSRAMQTHSSSALPPLIDNTSSPIFASLAGKSVFPRDSGSESSSDEEVGSNSSILGSRPRRSFSPVSLDSLFAVRSRSRPSGLVTSEAQAVDAAESFFAKEALVELEEELVDPALFADTVLPYRDHLFE